MRKPRDIDAELKLLKGKAKALKAKRVEQLGQLVVATGADTLDLEVLAGILRQGIHEAKIERTREAWREDGAIFFRRRGRKAGGDTAIDGSGTSTEPGGDVSDRGDAAS